MIDIIPTTPTKQIIVKVCCYVGECRSLLSCSSLGWRGLVLIAPSRRALRVLLGVVLRLLLLLAISAPIIAASTATPVSLSSAAPSSPAVLALRVVR